VPLIADALITKGSLVSMTGRAFEGNALLRTGQQLAVTNGLWQTAIRGLINISAGDYGRNPEEGLTAAREAMALSRRFGYRSTLATATGNALEAAVRMGDWEWVVTEGRRVLDEDLDPGDRFNVVRGLEEVMAYRGGDVSEMLEQHLRHVEASPSPVVESNYHGALAAAHFAQGDYDAAASEWRLSADLNAVNLIADLPRAGRAAIWAKDVATAKELLERFEALTVHGAEADAVRAGLAAGIGALEGRSEESLVEPMQLYAKAIELWDELNVRFDGALVGLEMGLTLGADEPRVKAALEKSHLTLASLGAQPFVQLAAQLAGRVASTDPAVGIDQLPDAQSSELEAATS
jgi:tetratricopeptide (TPR) repeat protein